MSHKKAGNLKGHPLFYLNQTSPKPDGGSYYDGID